MRSFLRLTDYKKEELREIFNIADNINRYEGFLTGKTVVMFFPANSIRTRVERSVESFWIFFDAELSR
ncbi:hypothetical protein [Butyrivibrio hungatei]|uniref:hypothetical protein n=1 Tax=Butyrivibrio hungatei TaxID=185008 RepID=UPI0003FD90E7|nr:hypothetical protein [Butyrivibrio hungatei]